MAGFTSDAEESVFKPAALQILIKFFNDMCWQVFVMAGQFGLKLRPVLLNDLVK